MPVSYPNEDEDFRSRYPVGMPADLAAIATRNLANEDASLARVNAVSRVATPFEGYARVAQYQEPGTEAVTRYPAGAGKLDFNAGTVTGNVPSFQTSMNPGADFGISDAMERRTETPTIADLHTDDIAQRRAAIDDQKKQIQARLGIISPKEAGLAAVVLAGPQERKDLLQNWQTLEQEDSNLLREHHLVTTEKARAAHENFARQKHILASEDFASMSEDLLQLEKDPKLKPGTPEFHARALEIAKNHPSGFMTQAGQTLFRGVSETHDKAASLEDRSYWQRFGQAFKEASQTARKRGVDVQYDEQGFPSTALTATAETDTAPPDRKLPAVYVKQAAALAEVKAKKDAAYNANKEADLTPHDRAINLEQAKLDAMKEALGIQDSPPTSSAAATPASAPDLKALAQKALADPNATEEHKKAARKILGQ